jgi:hypothetical protein
MPFDILMANRLTMFYATRQRSTYAIELDDATHTLPDRRERDSEVERIFVEANPPLVRIANKDSDELDIIDILARTKARVISQK